MTTNKRAVLTILKEVFVQRHPELQTTSLYMDADVTDEKLGNSTFQQVLEEFEYEVLEEEAQNGH